MIGNRQLLAGGLVIAILVGVAAVFFASGDPDGLESTALFIHGEKTLTGNTQQDAVIPEQAEGTFSYSPLMPDYSLGGNAGPAGSVAAIVAGILIAFCVVMGIAYVIKSTGKKGPSGPNQ